MRQEAHFIQLLKGNKKVKQQLLIGNKMEPLIRAKSNLFIRKKWNNSTFTK